MAAAARSVYFVPGGRGGRRGFLWNVVVVVWWRRCAGGDFLFSSGRGFKKKSVFEEETTAEVGEVGRGLAKPVQRNDHGVCGVHRPVRKRGKRERERTRGEERREERGVFFLQSSELECFNWHMLWDFACFGAVFPFPMRL